MTSVFGLKLDLNTKLAFLGFFNKLLDVFLIESLEHTASVVPITGMTSPKSVPPAQSAHGATFVDFRFKDELIKPWATLRSFWERGRRFRWNLLNVAYFVIRLAISLYVLPQGLVINTICILKQRWYANDSSGGWTLNDRHRDIMTIFVPKKYVHHINGWNFLGAGKNTVGDGGWPKWDFGLGLSATESFRGYRT
ncbi:hypothetical protein K469DRAFT_7270 [Zopfia rhizophila CBS 207.26]|uniref:Uncharacterized protein n=1 Tax=Zopfia rhizophila CBS 207.26 TaxID=1314779 RepID=A0A6A6EWW4_9PEZI|nr:hypothetical protein K469DRAFT_7270 [Zopfia rhizophila CBS 207.26]